MRDLCESLLIFAISLVAGFVALALFITPIYLPMMVLVYHGLTAKRFRQFSVGVFMALTAAECMGLAVSVTAYRSMPAVKFLGSLHGPETK